MASWRENSFNKDGEKSPLIDSYDQGQNSVHYGTPIGMGKEKLNAQNESAACKDGGAQIERTLGRPTAILLLVSCCCGTGIFVSPAGVTASVGSVGLTLIIWIFCGLFSMVLALCYAELGTAIPLAGGDYSYIEAILGPFPAFLCLWVMVVLVGPSACTLMGRTAGDYFSAAFGLDCRFFLSLIIAFLFMLSSAILNIYSVKWSARVASLFSMGKVLALGVIIVAGITKLAQGSTQNFEDIWEGSDFSAISIIFGIVPGYVTYAGWDAVNALAEEMKNPRRDIPVVAVVGLLLVTGVYVLVNVAYFSVLTPVEFVQSSVVVTNFSNKALASVAWLAPTFVIMSALGSLFSMFLVAPRWAFAGGRNGQIPAIFSYIHVYYHTPIPAIILLLLFTLAFCTAASFFDIQDVINVLGLFAQIKTCMALVALIYMKAKMPQLQGSIKIPMVVVVVSLVLLLIIIGTALYIDPIVMGFGMLLFLIGLPLYGLQTLCKRRGMSSCTDCIIVPIQQLLMVVPEEKKDV